MFKLKTYMKDSFVKNELNKKYFNNYNMYRIKNNNFKIIILWLVIVLSINAQGQIPANYYDGTEGLEEEALKAVLNDIIKGHTVYTYTSTLTDTWDILKESDADPTNSSNVILVYSGRSVNGPQEYNDGAGWTREHVWPNSRGDFGTVQGPGTDLHNLKPCDVSVNSARSNRWFDYADVYYYDDGVNTGSKTSYTDFVWEPRDEVKGDVARIIFYMATRYEGEDGEIDLEVVDYFPADDSYEPLMAILKTLKEWNEMDPVDDFERNRNNVIYSYQNNRNPFIDHPEFVEKIWGPVISESQGLFISEYIEGDGYDKAIEIYNNSESTIDLSNVKLQKDNGGDQSFSYSLSLSGTINPHDVFVISHNSASAEIRAKANLTTTSLVMTFNGDDQLRILYSGIETDHIGDVGNFGENRTFVKAGHVLKGDTSLVNPQLSLNWIELDNGNHSCLGYHYTNQTLTTPQLFISEYIEGSSYNKGIEIFNASSEVIDLSNVALLKQTNGLEGFSGFSLSGELNPYSVYCIVHPSATAALLEKADLQTVGGVMDFNGNDPVMLVYKGVAIDKIGNSGGANFAIDKGLFRNSSQALPSKEWNVAEWTNIAMDNFSFFGDHQYDYQPAPDTLYAIASGDWTDPSIWALTENGVRANIVPAGNTNVVITGYQIILSSDKECASVTLSSKADIITSLLVDGGNLSVYGKVILEKTNSVGKVELEVIGNGSLSCTEIE
ncbi:MAG TPA: hypothetical protein DCG75_04545 [Bacteroidales bacterium]|nr:hypothetical protein [Bacteroidales bacterium]